MNYAIYRVVTSETGYQLAFTAGPYKTIREAEVDRVALERLSRPNESGYREDCEKAEHLNYKLQCQLESLEPRKPSQLFVIRAYQLFSREVLTREVEYCTVQSSAA